MSTEQLSTPTSRWSEAGARAADSWWLRYFGSRLAQGLLVVLGAITVSFFLINASGDFTDALQINANVKADDIERLRHEFGYDRPLLVRYVDNVADISHGDFGTQYGSGTPARTLVLRALPNTAVLVLAAIVIAWPAALLVSLFSVLRRGTRGDWVVRQTVMVTQGVPEFWAALLLVLLFSVNLQWFPSIGFNDGVRSLVLPALALAIPLIPLLVRLTRGQLLDFMALDLATALRARGITDLRIVFRHGLPNVMVPTIHFLSLQLGWLLGGTLIVETVFAWPGMGQLLLTSVQQHELSVAQAVIVVLAIAFVVLNLLADVLSFAIDPRIRRAER